jgi:Flp pilus assembly CpaF family ATPase
MRPLTVSIDVAQERADVYAFLDVLANHERFTDHMLREWSCSGPATGVGATARVVNVLGGRRLPVEVEVIEAVEGERTTERNVSAGGRRVGEGTYTLADLDPGGTRVTFTYAWRRAPVEDRLLSLAVRRMMRRAFQRALDRLAGELIEAAGGTRTRAGASTVSDQRRVATLGAATSPTSRDR